MAVHYIRVAIETRVRWNFNESMQVFQEAVRLSYDNETYRPQDCIRAAQEGMLFFSRRKVLTHVSLEAQAWTQLTKDIPEATRDAIINFARRQYSIALIAKEQQTA